MKRIRRFLIFLLFFALFTTAVCILFGGELLNYAINLHTGAGATEYSVVTRGADGKIYALGYRNGLRIVCLTEKGREYDKKAASGLPGRFTVADMYVTESGAVLLSLNETDEQNIRYCGLYYSEGGGAFRLIMREKTDGKGIALSSISEYGGKLRFFVKKGQQYNRYSFDPAEADGLINDGVFIYGEDMVAGIIAGGGEAYIAGGNGNLTWFDTAGNKSGSLVSGRLYTRFMQYEEGFLYMDGRGGSLVAFDSDAKTDAVILPRANLPCSPESVNRIFASPDGGVLILEDYSRLYSSDYGGGFAEMTEFLYGQPLKSGFILAAVLLGLLIAAFCFYYLFCQARKMYFPLALRGLLTVGLLSVLIICVFFELLMKPEYIENMRNSELSALSVYARYIAYFGGDIESGAQALSESGFDGVNVYTLKILPDGPRILSSTETIYGEGFLANVPEAPGRFINQGTDPSDTLTLIKADTVVYAAYEQAGYTAVLVTADGRNSEEAGAIFYTRLTLMACALSLILAVFCAISLWSASHKTRKITREIDMLAAGIYDKTVGLSADDEFKALADRVNSLAGQLKKQTTSDMKRSDSFLHFIPQQLVSLMGVSRIEDVDKSTATSRDMAMIVIWFGFKNDVYQSDPKTLFDNINEVIERTSGIVSKNDGVIYDFTYNGYSAVFPSGSEAAVSAAVEIRQGIIALNRTREGRGAQPVTLRIAIDRGNVMMGVVGDDDRMVPTAVSSGFNTARMLVRLASTVDANILCTMSVADEAKSYFVRYIGKTSGRRDQIRVYEIIDGDEHHIRAAKEKMRDQFSKGIYSLYACDFTAAKRIFMDIARNYEEDGVTRHYLYLADKYENEAPDEVFLA